jgi:hypothetical protein
VIADTITVLTVWGTIAALFTVTMVYLWWDR